MSFHENKFPQTPFLAPFAKFVAFEKDELYGTFVLLVSKAIQVLIYLPIFFVASHFGFCDADANFVY